MERSAKSGTRRRKPRIAKIPDFAALHPGYVSVEVAASERWGCRVPLGVRKRVERIVR
jgi:hypothetical protein